MEVRLKINIDQNVPALVTSNANYEVTTYGAKIAHNCFSGIGTYPKYVHGCEIYLMPSGLTINPFIERGEDDKLEQFTNRVNKFINDANMTKFSEVLRIDKINAIQIIKMTKI